MCRGSVPGYMALGRLHSVAAPWKALLRPPSAKPDLGGTGRPQDQAPVMTRIRATLQCQPDTSGRTAGIKARTQTVTLALAIQIKDSNSNVGIAVQSTATRWGIAPVCSQCACSHRRAADVRARVCVCGVAPCCSLNSGSNVTIRPLLTLEVESSRTSL